MVLSDSFIPLGTLGIDENAGVQASTLLYPNSRVRSQVADLGGGIFLLVLQPACVLQKTFVGIVYVA